MTVSFIIIGRNEGFKLSLAVDGVLSFIQEHQLKNSEVIYVDSDSADDSVQRVRAKEGSIKIVGLKGRTNAAIARNAGAAVAKGSLFFFIDGDMELQPGFPFQQALAASGENLLFSGQIKNLVYDDSFKKELSMGLYYPGLKQITKEWYFGGLFAISARLWHQYGGMRTAFTFGEDLDLSMRLSENGHRLLRFPEVLALHRTMLKPLGFFGLLRNACYSRGFLYRKHLGKALVWRRILRSDPTVLIMLTAILAALVCKSMIPVAGYLLMALSAAFIRAEGNLNARLITAVRQPLRDVFVIGAFIFYYPSEKVHPLLAETRNRDKNLDSQKRSA